MTYEVLSSRSDMRKESFYFFIWTIWGWILYLAVSLILTVLGYFLGFSDVVDFSTGDSAVNAVMNFMGILGINLVLVPVAYVSQRMGGHFSEHLDDVTKQQVTVDGDTVSLDGNQYRFDQVSINKRENGFFLILGGMKVVFISNKNCSGYNELLELLVQRDGG